MNKNTAIRLLQDKKRLNIRYLDDTRDRLVEFYAVGKGENGNLVRAYQVSGASTSGQETGWKLFELKSIKKYSQKDKALDRSPRKGYCLNDKSMEIYKQLTGEDFDKEIPNCGS
jgi:hypothetical protein